MTRDEIVETARGFADICAGDAAYIDIIAPNETPARAAEMARMSGCALVQLGIFRAVGVEHPLLARPYVTGRAFGDILTIARAADAIHGPDRTPEAGDLLFVGDMGDGKGGGVGHVWMALSSPDDDGTLDGLDGGQRDERGRQVIRIRRHRIVDGSDQAGGNDPGGGRKRQIRYVIDGLTLTQSLGRSPEEGEGEA